MTTDLPAIDIADLAKTYRNKKLAKVNALRELTLQIAPGEVFGFLGPNGAGKSTTIKILTAQVRATKGTAQLFGVPVTEVAARKRLGYLPENPAFYDYLTASEYLAFVGKVFGLSTEIITARSTLVLERLELAAAAKRPIRGYSKGMVQRLGLAQTLLHDPDLYILDEPMSGLDPIGRALVKDIIRELKERGKTVFFSTHITADVEAVCDRLGVIVSGKLRAVDTVSSVLNKSLSGYSIHSVSADGHLTETRVAVEQLQPKLQQLVSAGVRIERIEPQRQDLEKFFLRVVDEAAGEH